MQTKKCIRVNYLLCGLLFCISDAQSALAQDWILAENFTDVHKQFSTSQCRSCHTQTDGTANWSTLAWYRASQHNPHQHGLPVGAYVIRNLKDDVLRSHLRIADTPALVVTTIGDRGDVTLRRGDVIFDVAEHTIDDVIDFRKFVESGECASLRLKILRNGEKQEVEVVVEEFQKPLPPLLIGVQVEAPAETLRSQLKLYEDEGIVVTEVVEESPAAEAGIQVHDILLRAGEHRLSDLGDLRAAVQSSGGESMSFVLMRGGEEQSLQVTPRRESVADATTGSDLEICPVWSFSRPDVQGLHLNPGSNEPALKWTQLLFDYAGARQIQGAIRPIDSTHGPVEDDDAQADDDTPEE